MQIFLSWSGERSGAIAKHLHDWLPLVLPFAEPWMSEIDIDAGAKWAAELGQRLDDSNYGIACLTPENLAQPWLFFEAGAIAKSVGGRLVPFLYSLDFADLPAPLKGFQAKKAERNQVKDLVESINKSAERPVPRERLELQFEQWWPRLEENLSSVPPLQTTTPPPVKQRQTAEVLDELVEVVRNLEREVRELRSAATPAYPELLSTLYREPQSVGQFEVGPVGAPVEESFRRAVAALERSRNLTVKWKRSGSDKGDGADKASKKDGPDGES